MRTPNGERSATGVERRLITRLRRAIQQLRHDVARESSETMAGWETALHRPGFRPAAENLACYLALRRRDLRALQRNLSVLGVSSLGRCESRVLPALDAVGATLDALAGRPAVRGYSAQDHRHGADTIRQNTVRLFGPDVGGPRTRIMTTMPADAATDPALVRQLLANGADCARINCAHDDPDTWRAIIRHVRRAARAQGRRCAVMMDLGGPKVRVSDVEPQGKIRLRRGDRFELRAPGHPASGGVSAAVSHVALLEAMTPSAVVWMDDGKIGARVVKAGRGRALLEVFHARDKGERLRRDKGLNLPGADLAIPALTAKDLEDLDFVASHADCVGLSFVQRPEDVRRLQVELARRRPGRRLPPVVLKVETALAVRNLPSLIVTAGGRQPVAVMIARGDLAVEIGLGRLSEIQEQLLWICEAAHVPVVWATQVLESLVRTGAPTRGEATDAAMGQRAECVMLNKGPHLVEAVAFLDDVLRRMDRHYDKKSARLVALRSWS